MIDYFEIYKAILETISQHNPTSGDALFNYLSSHPYFKSENPVGNQELVNTTLQTLDNLLGDGLVVGKKTATQFKTLYNLKGLSTEGYAYLQSTSDPSLKDKLKEYLIENGVPMTPQGVTKFFAHLTLK